MNSWWRCCCCMQRPITAPLRMLRAANRVVGHSRIAGLGQQNRLGAIERLDLGLLVDRQHQGVGRRVHVEAHDVLHLGGKGWSFKRLNVLMR
jgi:hypothetical protein